MNYCIIPARGGSKRIPRKNIKEFHDIPIIIYSIRAAIKSRCFEQVVVSTDDEEIAMIAKKNGAIAPFMRPKNLSGDFVATTPVINHAIEWLESQNNYVENICCLYATAPFVQSLDIKNAYLKLINTGADFCFGATSFPFPIQRAFKTTKNNRVNMFYPEHYNTRSQDLDEAYHDAGQFCWGRADSFKKELPVFSEMAVPYILPRHLVQDIDTMEDWQRAEIMYKLINN